MCSSPSSLTGDGTQFTETRTSTTHSHNHHIVVFSTSTRIPLTELPKLTVPPYMPASRSAFRNCISSSSKLLELPSASGGMLPIVLRTTPCVRTIPFEFPRPCVPKPKPKPEKGEPGFDLDEVAPAVKAIVPVDWTVSEPRSRRSRMSRHARTGESITLRGMQMAEMD